MKQTRLMLGLVATTIGMSVLSGCALQPTVKEVPQEHLPIPVRISAGHQVEKSWVFKGDMVLKCVQLRKENPNTGEPALYDWVEHALSNETQGKTAANELMHGKDKLMLKPVREWDGVDAKKGRGDAKWFVYETNNQAFPFVQRLNTAGGTAPVYPCGEPFLNTERKVSFSADYILWRTPPISAKK